MRRATITINDELEAMLDSYLEQQDVSPAFTSVVQAALREYLAHRGFTNEPKRLRITPAKRGSGSRDVSVDHDRYLAGK
jgi:hypothetical protein